MSDEDTKVSELINLVSRFRDKRGWKKFHLPRNLATSIVIEASELLELFQWDLKKTTALAIKRNKGKLKNIREELADIIIYCLSLASALDIDVSRSIENKIERNKKKYPIKHFNKHKQNLKYYKRTRYRRSKK